MASSAEQDYCDWCGGPLSGESADRSRWLGLTSEDAWACATCLDKGLYRVPPDGWDGPLEEWLARDQYVLSADDRSAIVNALTEVCYGPEAIEDWEFELRMGISRDEAGHVLRRIAGR